MKGPLRRRPLFVIVAAMALILLPRAGVAQDVVSQSTPDLPSIRASALYLVDLKSGRVLLAKNATRRLPPASLTKVMTALVALET